jgi:hypothetical protein
VRGGANRGSATRRRPWLLVVLLALALLVPAGASAATLDWSDDGNDFAVFGPAEQVAIHSGRFDVVSDCSASGIDDFIFPWTTVYVVPSAPGNHPLGTALKDVSGAPNQIMGTSGGLFIGEPIGNTHPAGALGEGTYAVIFDECQDGVLDVNDTVVDPAFEVRRGSGAIPSISPYIQSVKAAARVESDAWKSMLDKYNAVMAAIDAYDYAKCLMDPAECVAEKVVSFITDKATETARKAFGLKDVQEAAEKAVESQVAHYGAIADDPPDEGFRRNTPLPAVPRLEPQSSDPVFAPAVRLAGEAGGEGALAGALLHALERYQGAEQAQDGGWALVHARAIENYAGLLRDQIASTNVALARLDSALTADGRPLETASLKLAQLENRLADDGPTAAERREFHNLGLSDAAIDDLVAHVSSHRTRNFFKFEVHQEIEDLEAANEAAMAGYARLQADAADIVTTLRATPGVPATAPVADPGGHYHATEGSALALDGSGSTDADGRIVDYRWDLDRDGEFDDASGAAPSVQLPLGASGALGLEVTDDSGRRSLAYASLDVAETDHPPAITTSAPSDSPLQVEVGDEREFSVTASDPDGDATEVEWVVDGEPSGSGASFAYRPGSGAIGAHAVEAVASDSHARGGSARHRWVVGVVAADGDGDGWRANTDCDDAEPQVNPGMDETFGNDRDDDCDPDTPDRVTFNSDWQASAGSLPTASCPLWTGTDSSLAADPSIAGGVMTLPTGSREFGVDDDQMSFRQRGSQLRVPPLLVIEARMRYVSGSSAAPWRTPAVIAFTASPGVGNLLFIGEDEIFLTGPGGNSRGPAAAVDTDNSLHSYRIEVARDGSIRVSQDGSTVLEGSTFDDVNANGSTPRILWGDATSFASGTSEWAYFRHNAAAVKCRAPADVPLTSEYDASTGELPQQTCPAWRAVHESPAAPRVSGGNLHVETGAPDSDREYWIQNPPVFDVRDPVVVEARMRVASSSSQSPQRTGAEIGIAREPGTGNALYVGKDEIFLLAGNSTLDRRGPAAEVDTDDAFHTYRIEYGAEGVVDVYYDGAFAFSAPAFHNETTHGVAPRIYFGEGSLVARGSSDWAWVRHNGNTTHPCPGPPQATGDRIGAVEDLLSLTPPRELLANDLDPGGDPLEISDVSATSETHGTVALVGGLVAYLPEPDYHGQASYSYTVSDGSGGEDTATVAVDVESVNDAPRARPDSAAAEAGKALVLDASDLLANDYDLEGDQFTLNAALPGDATHGTVELDSGKLTYRPEPGFSGSARFRYRIEDGSGGSAIGLVEVTVAQSNHPPSVELDARGPVDEGAAPVALHATASDADGDVLEYSWTTTGGRLDASGSAATFAADDGPATETIRVEVSDGQASAAAERTIEVRNAPPAASAGNAPSPYWGVSAAFAGLASDPSGADTRAGLAPRWEFGDGTAASGLATSHTYAAAGTYAPRLTLRDKDGATASQALSVQVSRRPTALEYTGSTRQAVYGGAALSARLSDGVDRGTARLGGRTLVFEVDGERLSTRTDANGVASATVPLPLSPGIHSVAVGLAEDPDYLPSAAHATVTVGNGVGRAKGEDLRLTSGVGEFLARSDAKGVTGHLHWRDGAKQVQSRRLTAFGRVPGAHGVWFAGVLVDGRTFAVYAEDSGRAACDNVFRLWIDGSEVTRGPLQKGDVRIDAEPGAGIAP